MTSGRLEAFSDAVIATLMTIMVLELISFARQLMNLLGYALMVNALAIGCYGTGAAQAA